MIMNSSSLHVTPDINDLRFPSANLEPAKQPGIEDAESIGKMAVRTGNRIVLVPVREILWIQSNSDRVRIHVAGTDYDCRMTMADVEEKLPRGFLRVHRSAIVNLRHVLEFILPRSGNAFVSLSNGQTLPISKSGRSALREYLMSTSCLV